MPNKLSLLTRASVMLALDEFQRLGCNAFLNRYGFGPARSYFVKHPVSGLLCDSKAIAGAAYGFVDPEQGPLRAPNFSGGEATVERALLALGFEVVATDESRVGADESARRHWSPQEVDILVADYLQMLAMELTGQSYSKAARRRALLPLLDRRTEASIEFKRRNVSAVMSRLGLPRIRGYLPAENVQGEKLTSSVAAQLRLIPAVELAAEAAVERPALTPQPEDYSRVRTQAPPRTLRAEERAPAYRSRRPIRRDYLALEERNRSLGLAGEHFIVNYERWRLLHAGLGQLADRVSHSSLVEGDGLGYDVLSFETDGTQRFIEVKTTSFGEETPFFVSANEVDFSASEPSRFKLCRVFDFRVEPRFFEVTGPVESNFYLDPASYRASLG